MLSTSAILLACTGHSTQRPSGTRSLIGASLRWPLEPQPAHRAGLDGVDRQCAAVDAPSGRRAHVLVVVTQMPHQVGDLSVALGPVVGDTGNAAQRVVAVVGGRVDLTDDGVLQAMGEPTLGLITSFHYSAAHDSPENKAFLKAYTETNGTKLRANFMACAGYDGMAAIAEALKKTQGSTDPDKLLAALKGMKLNSPRGPIMIDPETRDIVQTVYIRRVEKVNGALYNVEFDKFPDQKDPGK